MKPVKFRLHFNRINMQRGNPAIWTVHTSKQCIQVKRVVSYVSLETVYKPDGPQPRAYLVGRGRIDVVQGTAYIFR